MILYCYRVFLGEYKSWTAEVNETPKTYKRIEKPENKLPDYRKMLNKSDCNVLNGNERNLWYVSENESEDIAIKKFMDYYIKRMEKIFEESKELRRILDSLEKIQK